MVLLAKSPGLKPLAVEMVFAGLKPCAPSEETPALPPEKNKQMQELFGAAHHLGLEMDEFCVLLGFDD